jgi:hypothetical protein
LASTLFLGGSRGTTGAGSSSSSSSSSKPGRRRGAGASAATEGRALLHGALVSPDNPFADPFADLDTPRQLSGSPRPSQGARPARSQTQGGLGLSGAL